MRVKVFSGFTHFIHRHGKQKVNVVRSVVDRFLNQPQALQVLRRYGNGHCIVDGIVESCRKRLIRKITFA